ncbi:MAG: DUF983 domain-containing protein [Sphingomonadales bacterium]|nr:MAG: DUF983 domain-containing protein [Sphingomonadales bacterium]
MPPPVDSGLKGSCPRCGAKTLFRTFTAFADTCSACGLAFSKFNVGDGPVVFMTLGIGALIVILSLWVEFTFEPGVLIHALLWIPLTFGLVVLSLRFAKGLLLALEFRNRAHEGRLKDPI